MAKSIMQSEKACWVCGRPCNLHKHHIFGGGNRKNSEKHGFTVYLCAYHHNLSNEGVHFNKQLDTELKQSAQRRFETTHTRAEFMQIIGKNYLENKEQKQNENNLDF